MKFGEIFPEADKWIIGSDGYQVTREDGDSVPVIDKQRKTVK